MIHTLPLRFRVAGIAVLGLIATGCAAGGGPANPLPRGAGQAQGGTAATVEAENPARCSVAGDTLTLDYIRTLARGRFGELVEVGATPIRPAYLTGDFNGDGRTDLVVMGVLGSTDESRTRGAQIYGPLGTGMHPKEGRLQNSAKELSHRRGSVVQLVIHNACGDVPPAPQDYTLLLYAVIHENRLERSRAALVPLIIGHEPVPIKPPRLRGDAILLLDDRGSGGAVYWDGERYRWYPYERD